MALTSTAVSLTLTALVSSVYGLGTVLELHKLPYFDGGDPVWVLPDPTVGSPGAPAGCTNLPEGFTFQSGRFYWNETVGKGRCDYIWFFPSLNCGDGSARGVEIPAPPADGSPWVSQDALYSRTTYQRIMEGKSVGCSYEKDPCKMFPCADEQAVCNSTWWSWTDNKGKTWAQQTRNCSACKDGFVMGDAGKCVKGEKKGGWLNALNKVRDDAKPKTNGLQKTAVTKQKPIQWDDNLAQVAKNWTEFLNSTQCGADPVVLTKIPGGNYSESDVWVSWSTDESAAVQLWAPSPTDASNPRTARITDQTTRLTGCGKTLCGAGAFFTCLFWPKTF